MSAENLIQLGEELKEQREAKNIQLQQIHYKTRIDINFLEAIEEGNFDVLPEVYIRAFIKEYAAVIDLNPTAVIEKYDALKHGGKFSIGFEAEKIEKHKPSDEPEKTKISDVSNKTNSVGTLKLSKNAVIISGISIVALAFILYFAFFSGSEKKIITERPFEEIRKEQTKRFDIADSLVKKSTQKPETPAENSQTFNLNIVCSDTSWIRVEIDNSTTKEMILYPGGNSMLDAQNEVRVLIGNSGAVEFFLDNKKLEFAGIRKSVKYVKITRAGLEYLRIKKASGNEQN